MVVDENGIPIENWWERFQWVTRSRTDKPGSNATLELDLGSDESTKPIVTIIGTVEAGYRAPCIISDDQARTLAELASREALKIYRATLSHVLATIAASAREYLGATYASLHFAPHADREGYAYESSSGLPLRELHVHRPRPDGIGYRALQERKTNLVIMSSASPRDREHLAMLGIEATVAAPLVVDELKGVLYLGYKTEPPDEVVMLLTLFADFACDAIRQAVEYTRAIDNRRGLETLHEVTQALVGSDTSPDTLVREIGGCAAIVLGADVVRIYEYFQSEKKLERNPTTVGRLLVPLHENTPQPDKMNPPQWLVDGSATPIYESDTRNNDRLSVPKQREPNFVSREDIRSTAATPLVAAGEIVGVMFVNYRRRHFFHEDEKGVIATLASTAAIAIRNRRLYKQHEDEVMMVTHQIRSNIRAARVWLDGASNDLAELRNFAARARDFLADSLDMFEGIFFVTRPDRRPTTEFNLYEQLVGMCNRLKSTTRRKSDISFEYPEPGTTFRARLELFKNVLYCLLENAMKYADPESVVRLAYDSEGDNQILTVESTGEPIDRDERERIFEKFRKGKMRSGESVGAGLGLWVARQVMTHVNGNLTVELSVRFPRRSTFVITWPRSDTNGPQSPE
jgi:GAF domain-containing protein